MPCCDKLSVMIDADVLGLAIRALPKMAGVNRIIGPIPHFANLRERIGIQSQVEK